MKIDEAFSLDCLELKVETLVFVHIKLLKGIIFIPMYFSMLFECCTKFAPL